MVALMVCSLLVAAGQPPAERREVLVWDVNTPKPDDLQAALANHPDVQIAEAKLRIAQSELAKVKLLVAQQVTAAKAKLEAAKFSLAAAEAEAARVKKEVNAGTLPRPNAERVDRLVANAKAAVASVEADLRAVLGVVPAVQPRLASIAWVERISADARANSTIVLNERFVPLSSTPAPAGTTADKLRVAVGTTFKLDIKGPLPVDEAFAAVMKGAGLEGVTVRLPHWASKPYPGFTADTVPTVPNLVGEQSFSGWLGLVCDSIKSRMYEISLKSSAGKEQFEPHELYVREYGLLFTTAKLAPQGALTLADFAAQAARTDSHLPVNPQLRRQVQELLNTVVKLEPVQAAPQTTLDKLAMANKSGLMIRFPLARGDGEEETPGGERTVAAWLDLLRDQWARVYGESLQFYVREYGLILSIAAPPGAVPLSQMK